MTKEETMAQVNSLRAQAKAKRDEAAAQPDQADRLKGEAQSLDMEADTLLNKSWERRNLDSGEQTKNCYRCGLGGKENPTEPVLRADGKKGKRCTSCGHVETQGSRRPVASAL